MIGVGGITTLSRNSAFGPRDDDSLDFLDFLFSQHVTQLSVCELLSKLADDHNNITASHDAAAIVDCFTEWLPRHEAIEEQQLLGLVGRYSLPDDDFDGMLEQLQVGHRESRVLADELMGGLHAIATGRHLKDADGFRATAMALYSHHRALVQWEDDVLYPFVRQRLASADLNRLTKEIASGRAGLEPSRRSRAGGTRPRDETAEPPARRKRH